MIRRLALLVLVALGGLAACGGGSSTVETVTVTEAPAAATETVLETVTETVAEASDVEPASATTASAAIRTEPQAKRGLILTINGVQIKPRRTRVNATLQNTTDRVIECGYYASLVADGKQVDDGGGPIDDIAANATLDSFYEWATGIPADSEQLRLIAVCYAGDDRLEFDIPVTIG